jgi:hypothetical protein
MRVWVNWLRREGSRERKRKGMEKKEGIKTRMRSDIDGGNGVEKWERKKERKVRIERQRRRRKGKGMVSVLIMVGRGKRGRRKKGRNAG